MPAVCPVHTLARVNVLSMICLTLRRLRPRSRTIDPWLRPLECQVRTVSSSDGSTDSSGRSVCSGGGVHCVGAVSLEPIDLAYW